MRNTPPIQPSRTLYSKIVYIGKGYWIKRKIINHFAPLASTIIFSFFLPFIFVNGIILGIIGRIRKRFYCTTINGKKIRLAIAVIVKGEEDYIAEWIAFHKAVGIDKIYVYDNSDNEAMKERSERFIKDGFVKWIKFPGNKMQMPAYNDCLRSYGKDCKYIALIDCDEFLLPLNDNQTLQEILDCIFSKHKNAGGVAVNWCMYGSSGKEKKEPGLVIERFKMRGDISGGGNDCIKTIVIPECVRSINHCHYPIFKLGFYNVSTDGKMVPEWSNRIMTYSLMRINHYFTKSKEEWISRRSQGKADHDEGEPDSRRTMEEFYIHDRNDVYDDLALRYSDKIKSILKDEES